MSNEQRASGDVASPERYWDGEEPAFALDPTNRIIFWNDACAALFGRSSVEVLGKACYEVVVGTDMHDNIYCYPNCPVMYKLRSLAGWYCNDFPLRVRARGGAIMTTLFSSIAIPASDPLQNSILHVLRGDGRLPDCPAETENRSGGAAFSQITPRELEVIQCLAQGMTTRRIAKILFITPTTVRNHVQSILQKLGVHTRSAVVSLAYQRGLITK